MVGIDTKLTVEIETTVVTGHKRAVDGDLVQIDANAMILGVAIEEHAELKQRVWRVFDARDHAPWGECGLFNITVIIFGVSVENQAAKLMHLEMLAGRSEHQS